MNVFAALWNKTGKRYKYLFFSTILFGVLSQGMGLFNKFSVSDDINYSFNGGDPLPYGRWMLYFLRRSERIFYGDGLFSLPVINGTITIICIAVSFCLLVNLLDLCSPVLCVLLGGAAVSIPCITSLFGHMYVAHFYSYALLLAVLGPYLILKNDKWYYTAAGIVLMVCSTAIYQAYIPVILSTFLIGLIKKFYDSDTQEQRIPVCKKTAVIFFSCLIFIGSYLLITKLINSHYGIILTGYKSIDKTAKLSPVVYLLRGKDAYKEFFSPSVNTYFNIFPGNIRILYFVMLFMFLLLLGKLLFAEKNDPAGFLILFLLFLLIPLSVNFIFVMAEPSDCSALMVYGKVMFYVMFAWALENAAGNDRSKLTRWFKYAAAGIFGLLVWMNCRFDNTCYLRMALVQTQATRYYSTLVTRIQSAEGYDSWKNVSYIGIPQPGADNSINNIPELDHIIMHPYFGLQNTLKGNWREYMRVWCGFSPHEVDQSYFAEDPEVRAMPHYPDDGSIKVIGDTVVVRF